MLPKVDGLGLQILFILLPGIIALGIVKALGPKRPRTDFESGLQIFVYGVISYLVAGPVFALYRWNYTVAFGKTYRTLLGESYSGLAANDPSGQIDAIQILLAICAATVIGCVVSVLQTYSVAHRLMRRAGITTRIGDIDYWNFVLSSPDLDHWVTVRHPNGKVYQGWVKAYSDGGDERELVLSDVIVYDMPKAGPPEEGSVEIALEPELVAVDTVEILYLGLDRKTVVMELMKPAPAAEQNSEAVSEGAE